MIRRLVYTECEGHFFNCMALSKACLCDGCSSAAPGVMGFILMKAADCRNMIMRIKTGWRIWGMHQHRISVLRFLSEWEAVYEEWSSFSNDAMIWTGANNVESMCTFLTEHVQHWWVYWQALGRRCCEHVCIVCSWESCPKETAIADRAKINFFHEEENNSSRVYRDRKADHLLFL